MGIPRRGGQALVAKDHLEFPEVFALFIEQKSGGAMAQAVGADDRGLSPATCGREAEIESVIGYWAAVPAGKDEPRAGEVNCPPRTAFSPTVPPSPPLRTPRASAEADAADAVQELEPPEKRLSQCGKNGQIPVGAAFDSQPGRLYVPRRKGWLFCNHWCATNIK